MECLLKAEHRVPSRSLFLQIIKNFNNIGIRSRQLVFGRQLACSEQLYQIRYL